MASNPITLWQEYGEEVETLTDFIFLGSKITVNGDCSHKIKRHLLLARNAMTNLDRVLKSRDITLPTKVCIVKAMIFPIVMYRCVFVSVTQSCPTLVTPWTVARQAPVSMEFSRQEYCSGLPFATTGDLPCPGI